jgi:hypothetical protein
MTESSYESELAQLTGGLPAEHRPWPFGMPTSVSPRVVMIGASPGSSPESANPHRGSEQGRAYEPPTTGCAHPGFYYRDASYYWDKIRVLCTAVVRCDAPEVSEDEALALEGHFNLGTGLAGTATLGVVEPGIVTWLSRFLGSVLPVGVVIGVGLNAILSEPTAKAPWNRSPGGLRVDWASPERSYPFLGYRFRTWEARGSDGESVLVCPWPNHPSRNPFTGPVGPAWQVAVAEFCRIMRQRG